MSDGHAMLSVSFFTEARGLMVFLSAFTPRLVHMSKRNEYKARGVYIYIERPNITSSAHANRPRALHGAELLDATRICRADSDVLVVSKYRLIPLRPLPSRLEMFRNV